MADIFSRRISLLWPDATAQSSSSPNLRKSDAPDLELDEIARALSIHPRHTNQILGILYDLCPDPAVTAYRQDVLDDLIHSPALTLQLEKLLDTIGSFDRYSDREQWFESQLHQVAYRLGELSIYVDCITFLRDTLNEAGDSLRSAALRNVRDTVEAIAADETFIHLKAELPGLLAKIENIHSVTVGINLNHDLLPVGATILSINDFRFKGESSFLSHLFRAAGDKPANEGIGPLHAAPGYQEVFGLGAIAISDELVRASPLLVPLMKDLAQILNKSSKAIAASLWEYMKVDVGFLISMASEIAFYLGAVRLIERLQDCGLPMCRPEIAPADERVCVMEGAYNLNLALLYSDGKRSDLRAKIVANDVNFGPEGRIFILTGPNRGGKTVYTQATGLAQVLFQAGLHIPARSARMSPVDGIFTHFAAVERISQQTGRLGEEARRLSAIFARATSHSLILLNESLSSTSAGESLYLARDLVRVMRMLGTRAIFATHLHDLAADVDNINAETSGDSAVISMIAMVTDELSDGDHETAQRTYKIVPGPPMGKSYAREIASHYGISFEQLCAALRARSLLPEEE